MSENNKELIKQITDIIRFVGENNLSELDLETKSFNLKLKKYRDTPKQIVPQYIEQTPVVVNKPVVSNKTVKQENKPTKIDSSKIIKAPMAGTFYAAPSPEAAPFIKVGDTISVGQTICIIEAMKMLNEIQSDKAGKVIEIKGKNGEPIEKGSEIVIIG